MIILIIEKDDTTYKHLLQLLPKLVDQALEIERIVNISHAKNWLLSNAQPDLIISEIDFDNQLIFDLHHEIKLRCPIIMTATTKDYAIDAFEMNTVDYLLKPLTVKKLAKSLKKFFMMKQAFLGDKQLNTYKERFFVSIGNKMLYILQSEISFFLSEDKAVYIYTNDGRRYLIDYTLDTLQTEIDPQLYFRINRQVLAQLKSIVAIKKHEDRRLLISLNHGETNLDFIVSRSRVRSFKIWAGKHLKG